MPPPPSSTPGSACFFTHSPRPPRPPDRAFPGALPGLSAARPGSPHTVPMYICPARSEPRPSPPFPLLPDDPPFLPASRFPPPQAGPGARSFHRRCRLPLRVPGTSSWYLPPAPVTGTGDRYLNLEPVPGTVLGPRPASPGHAGLGRLSHPLASAYPFPVPVPGTDPRYGTGLG